MEEYIDIKDFDYDLPKELIAQEPIKERSMSRLLVLDKETGQIKHSVFKNIVDYLNPGDCLVLNDTRVIPARIYGKKEGTNGAIEFVLLKRFENDEWEVMLRPGKRAKVGAVFFFGEGILKATVLKIVEGGNRIIKFEYEGVFEEILDTIGIMPLPPYITKELKDPERYQTVYSKYRGSAAAPTAGLHFTKELLQAIKEKGIRLAYVTLHVGIGTFRPVKTNNILEHKMHSEYYEIHEDAAKVINDTKKNGNKVICVGTTSCRVIETAASDDGIIRASSGNTDIFIYPGYKFKIMDELITNFHLPESTLLMLVSALAGRENVLAAYKEAVKERYRFFSFGDAMFISSSRRFKDVATSSDV